MPFDPTPGRGTFSATYSFASDSAEAVDALGRGRLETLSGTGRDGRETDGFKVASLPSPRDQPSILLLAFVLAAVSAAVIGTVKWLVRRLRYLTIQPRLIAAASRKELEAFLRDQGIAVPRERDPRRLAALARQRSWGSTRERSSKPPGAVASARLGTPAVLPRTHEPSYGR